MESSTRRYWIETMLKISEPVISALAEGRLHRDMPVENGRDEDRTYCTHLEALGRTIDGVAPWLASTGGDEWERAERERFAELCRRAIANSVDPESPDYMRIVIPGDGFNVYAQPLVDIAFLVQGILLAKGELFDKLSEKTKGELVDMMKLSRRVTPIHNNWLLFSAMVEAGLYAFTGECDLMRVDFALTMHESWYKGDGVYGDGAELSRDYYNSFVIQPMLIDVIEHVGERLPKYLSAYSGYLPRDVIIKRAQTYAEHLEQLVAADGSFPAIGRSITYRMGAFRLLSQIALMHLLPDSLSPASVRCALTAVIRRSTEAPGTFDADGWLTIGVCGHQRHMAQGYISTGSLYLCTGVFLALGLPADDEFWTAPDEPWSWKRIWG